LFLSFLQNNRNIDWKKPTCTSSLSSTSIAVYPTGKNNNIIPETKIVPSTELSSRLPMLTSHCPGWVCYAEKTTPQALPYLSTVKSAQQICGSVIKSALTNDNSSKLKSLSLDGSYQGTNDGNNQQKVFVVSVQPCPDKKLEASRKDFYHQESGLQEVDLVLSTTELWQILEEFSLKWSSQQQQPSERASIAMEVDNITVDLDKDLSETNNEQVNLSRKTFPHVYEYLSIIPLDSPSGCDEIERMFRCYSHDGLSILAASESNNSSGSAGAIEYIFKYIAEKLYGMNLWNLNLPWREGRNPDITEIDLKTISETFSTENNSSSLSASEMVLSPSLQLLLSSSSSTGSPPFDVNTMNFKVGRAAGFRNIQTILNKMKKRQYDLDLVEVLACPSGCNNGGGQLKALSSITTASSTAENQIRPETPAESKERIARTHNIYQQNLVFQQPDQSPLVQYIYSSDRLKSPLSEESKNLFHTRYHAIPTLETIAPLAAKW
jgi:iron only hydrogenase large subunit-like protein